MLFSSNKQGFRGPEVSKSRNDKNSIRIMFLGDSSTFGFPFRYEHSFSALVENMANQRLQCRFETINAGMVGFSLARINKSMEDYFSYSPDYIFVMVGYHYQISRHDANRNIDKLIINHRSKYWLMPPVIVELIFIFRPETEPHDFLEEEYLEFGEQLRMTAKMACERDIQLVFLEYPSVNVNEKVNELIRKSSDLNGIDFIAQKDCMIQNKGLHWDNTHPNLIGHQMIAENVVEYLLLKLGDCI